MFSLSARLKIETRAAHEATEGSLGVLMSPALTRETYARIVAGFYGFYRGWEDRAAQAIAAAGGPIDMFEARRKAETLACDLRSLGWSADQVRTVPVCASADLPPTESFADVLGTWYVLEGSTQGGQIISKRLEEQLGLRDGVGYAYFRGAGPETMSRWRAFKSMLDAAMTADAHASVVASASTTFERLSHWLSAQRD